MTINKLKDLYDSTQKKYQENVKRLILCNPIFLRRENFSFRRRKKIYKERKVRLSRSRWR